MKKTTKGKPNASRILAALLFLVMMVSFIPGTALQVAAVPAAETTAEATASAAAAPSTFAGYARKGESLVVVGRGIAGNGAKEIREEADAALGFDRTVAYYDATDIEAGMLTEIQVEYEVYMKTGVGNLWYLGVSFDAPSADAGLGTPTVTWNVPAGVQAVNQLQIPGQRQYIFNRRQEGIPGVAFENPQNGLVTTATVTYPITDAAKFLATADANGKITLPLVASKDYQGELGNSTVNYTEFFEENGEVLLAGAVICVEQAKEVTLTINPGEYDNHAWLTLPGKWRAAQGGDKGNLVFEFLLNGTPMSALDASKLEFDAEMIGPRAVAGNNAEAYLHLGVDNYTFDSNTGRVTLPVEARKSGVIRVECEYALNGVTATASTDVIIPGDVNGSNRITSADLITIHHVNAGYVKAPEKGPLNGYAFELYDINCDGKLAPSDAVYLHRMLIGICPAN